MPFNFRNALKNHGGVNALAEAIGVSHQAISQWREVPPKRVLAVEAAWGVSRHVIRPDVYGPELSATSSPSASDSPSHTGRPSPCPNSETSESPQPVHGLVDHVVTPSPVGG